MRDGGVGSWPARRARMAPDGVTLRQDDRQLTYRQLADRVDSLARTLRRLGVAPGVRVAYLGANDITTFRTLFATMHLGAIFVPLNTRLAGDEIAYMLGDSGAKVLVHGPDKAATVADAKPFDQGVQHVVAAEALPDADDNDPVDVPVGMDDPALILYTSGTTGRPKGAVLTHGNLTWNTVNQLAHFDLASGDVALCVAPLFHVTGLGQVTLPTLFKGGTVVVASKFDPSWMLQNLAPLGITGFSAVPTMLKILCDHPQWESADLSSLKLVVYGGSSVSERVAKQWLDRGVRILQGYGMTEASPGVYMAMPDGSVERPISIGVPHFFTEVAMLGEHGSPEPPRPGVRAELLVRGPNVFGGYWQRPDATADAFLDGWYRSGDVLTVEEDGWAYVVDRVRDVIISGGENVYPAEVEAALLGLDGIADAAVVAVPDEQWGEVGFAYVVLGAGEALDMETLPTRLERRLARYKIPKYFQVVDELPRNATGKVVRAQLREKAADLHAEGEQTKGRS